MVYLVAHQCLRGSCVLPGTYFKFRVRAPTLSVEGQQHTDVRGADQTPFEDL